MPELPEVEIQTRGLVHHIIGRVIINVKVIVPNSIADGIKRNVTQTGTEKYRRSLTGKKILSVTRRAKNIIIHVSSDLSIVSHLKMTGQWLVVTGGAEPPKGSAIIFYLDNGTQLVYKDTRKFGYCKLMQSHQVELFLATKNYGLEPLSSDFTLIDFTNLLQIKARSSLKSVLLSQSTVVGLGNIYADEVCFESRIRPGRIIESLSITEIKKLYMSIKPILEKSIAHGGSSLTKGDSLVSYRDLDGAQGRYSQFHQVYGRAGKECEVCKTILTTMKISSRTTVWCSSCQK